MKTFFKLPIGLYLNLLILTFFFCSCNKDDQQKGYEGHYFNVCVHNHEILPPPGFEIKKTGQLDFDGYVRKFQFISEQLGYIMARELYQTNLLFLKTTNGGETWNKLYTGKSYKVLDMNFFDENLGIITLDNRTGSVANAWDGKCAILRTENGGLDWEEVIIEELEGRFINIQFDDKGVLFAQHRDGDSSQIVKSEDYGLSWEILHKYELFERTVPTRDFRVFEQSIYTTDGMGRIIIVPKDGSTPKIITNEELPFLRIYKINANTFIAVNSEGITKSDDGGLNWEQTAEIKGEFIGFEDGLTGIISKRGSCVSGGDVLQGTIQFASTFDGGSSWGVSEKETLTYTTGNYINAQYIGNQKWRVWFGTSLFEITAN